jgi:hypothetical protein
MVSMVVPLGVMSFVKALLKNLDAPCDRLHLCLLHHCRLLVEFLAMPVYAYVLLTMVVLQL